MTTILNRFAAAATLAAGLSAATAGFAQQQGPADLNAEPGCLAFDAVDKEPRQFPDGPMQYSYELYADALKKFAQNLAGNSEWQDVSARLGGVNGVCVYPYGPNAAIATYDEKNKTIDINISVDTIWGSVVRSPQEVDEMMDFASYYAIYIANVLGVAGTIVTPDLAPETAAMLMTVSDANSRAEAILSTTERGIAEGRLDDLLDIMYNNNPMLEDQISELYVTATDADGLTAEDRQVFRAATVQAFITDEDVRAGTFEMVKVTAASMGMQGIDISTLFDEAPDDTQITNVLGTAFGADLADLQIDGKPVIAAYRDYWAAATVDPADQAVQEIEKMKAALAQALRGNTAPAPAPQP